jgi:shikimate kinase/3-dehydroquinate synthase
MAGAISGGQSKGDRAMKLASLIFLYGPPGSGKSTNGQLLAEKLALPFVDLDQQIEKRSGMSIPEIFAKEGESGFRHIEQAELKDALNLEWGVIALGGGALLNSENRTQVEIAGPILCLSASPEVLLERLDSTGVERPLLSGDKDSSQTGSRLLDLLVERNSHYASFANQIDTVARSPEQIVWDIQILLGAFHVLGMVNSGRGKTNPGVESVRPQPLGYDVRVQDGALKSIGSALKVRGLSGSISLVADENVAAIYLSRAINSLQEAGYLAKPVILPPGEIHKTISTVSYLWEQFLENGVERNSTVVALGGGVVGDLVGFAAATYLRGVPWVVLPTSLLAMADASLGGKTGADLPQGKNLVGAFHPPQLVLTDPETLATLPQEELCSGIAEVIKAGIIGDPILFAECAQGWQGIMSNWSEIIRRAMAVKIRVIEADPFEAGLRAVLNFGHTIGHAVELVSNFELRHGEAVAIGMVAEAWIAEQIGMTEPGLSAQIKDVCARLGLPTEVPRNLPRQAILDAMQVDKKRSGGRVRFALPQRIGEVKRGVDVKDLNLLLF